MATSIWSKQYKVPPIKLKKIFYVLVLILVPNIVFLLISIVTETSRPFLDIDYVLPVMLILLNNRLCQWLGFISLVIMTIPDLAMFVMQLFPFVDLQGALYLAPFLLQGPTRYIVFILIITLYTLSVPILIKSLSKPTDNFHTLLVGSSVLLLSYFASTSDLEYRQGSGVTFGSNNYYVAASQMRLYFEVQDISFLKEGGLASSFSPTQYERVVTQLSQPLNDKILLIVVESLGAASNHDLQRDILKPVAQQQSLFESYDNGIYEGPASTVDAELKELCAQDVKGYGLRLVPDSSFPLCLPKVLADKGYQTTALHGASGKLYDRFSWYKKAGFADIMFSENLHDAERCSAFHGVCDDEVFPIIKDYFKADKPAFFYWMTLTSHAPYAKKDIYSERIECASYGIKDDEVCRNMQLQAQFFEGLAELNKQPEMSGVEVVLVGDHLPPIISGVARVREYEYLSVTWLHYKIK